MREKVYTISKKDRQFNLIVLAITVFLIIIYLIFEALISKFGFPGSAHFDPAELNKKIFILENTLHSYHWFRWAFATDFFFGASLLFLLFRVAKTELNGRYLGFYIALLLITLAVDYTENVLYLASRNLWLMPLTGWTTSKFILYGLSFTALLIYYIHFTAKDPLRRARAARALRNISSFIKYGWISLVFILMILLLMTQMDQGITLVVDLFFGWVNIALILIFLFFGAIVVSHYPAYMEAFYAKDQNNISWCIHPVGFLTGITGFGYVTFRYPKGPKSQKIAQRRKLFNQLRHYLGLFLISMFMYIIIFAAQESQMGRFFNPNLAYVVFGVSIWVYHKVEKRLNKRKYFRQAAWISTALFPITLMVIAFFQWSVPSLAAILLYLLSLQYLLIHIRIWRSTIFSGQEWKFIRIISIAGFISLVPLLISNFCIDDTVQWFNPILILFLYLINFYGFAMILIKHLFFYYERKKEVCKNKHAQQIHSKFAIYQALIPGILIGVVLMTQLIPQEGNKLHSLCTYPVESKQEVVRKDYLEHVVALSQDSTESVFQVASYGGGLKADLWTLLVLNELQKKSEGEFLRRTLSMSGTSGGMIGLGNYAQLWASNARETKLDSQIIKIQEGIYNIGTFKHLTIDITYLLGKDLIREYIPTAACGTDRSTVAMRHYARLAGMDMEGCVFERPYWDHWAWINDRSGYYPPLIINSYATRGNQGSGLSLDLQKKFPGTIDVAKPIDNKQISYYGALSTSNRFPIFSPTANISQKGHFLDGGYFDNSGLGLTLFFREEMLPKEFKRERIRIVIINNSKTAYIKSLYDPLIKDKMLRENSVGEISAILQSVASTDKMPNYFEDLVRNQSIHVYLPHPISYADIIAAYQGVPAVSPEDIFRIMKESNDRIWEALDDYRPYELEAWGVVEPPLARLNSIPAVLFQEAMIKRHKGSIISIESICDKIRP